MSVISSLFIILFILMVLVGGKRGIRSYFTICFNFLVFFILIICMAYGFNPILVALFGCIIISIITLFMTNGVNHKTISSLISVIIVVLLTIIIIYYLGEKSKIQGFGEEEAESIGSYSLFINNDFVKTSISVICLSFIGAIIDVSISISSSMNELYFHNKKMMIKDLYKAGLNIGKDILGTMTNTLFFAYISSFMTLIIWFMSLKYNLTSILNAKVFGSEIIQILCSGIGVILIIPMTSIITAYILKNKIFFINTK